MNEETKAFNKKIAIRYIVHMLVTLLIFGGIAYFANEIVLDGQWEGIYLQFTGILYVAVAIYSFLDRKRLYRSARNGMILSCCFLISAMLLFLSDYYVNIPIWLIGGIVAAALVNRNIGLFYVYFFIFHAIYLQGDAVNGLVYHFLCATVLCILIPKMKTWASMLYLMIFAGALVIALAIIMNRFSVDSLLLLDAFSMLCTYLICIFAAMLFGRLLGESTVETEESYAAAEEEFVEVNYDYLDLLAQETSEGDYSAFCDEKAELLQELKKQKKATYAHAMLVGKLSCQAAEAVGMNAAFAKAIGFYQKIGKLHNEQPETHCLILKEHQFPDTLIDAVSQLALGKPEIKETALVAMADEIISNYSVIRHAKKLKLPVEKIVDKTLSKKMFSGMYDASGLSVSEYTGIRNVFVAFLEEQDRKHGFV